MRQVLLSIFLFATLQIQSQVFFSKVYTVPEDGSGLVNKFPNWLSAVFPTDTLIYAFGYSADRNYKDIYGTAFYTFDWEGNLLDYYHIKDDSLHNFFYPEGIHTWDGITFYTGFNHFDQQESILKFNRITREQTAFEIKNSIYSGGRIVFNNFTADMRGYLITASNVETGIPNQFHKIQVTKIDTTGYINWQKIIGKEPIIEFNNIAFSSLVDKDGFVYIGIGYTSYFGLGAPGEYENLLYKLDSLGNTVKIYNSQRKQGFCFTYDIVKDNKGWVYLCSDYNYNEPQYPYANRGYGIIQALDTSMKFRKFIPLNFANSLHGEASDNAFDKIINSNDKNGFIVGGDVSFTDTLVVFDTLSQKYDSTKWRHDILNLVRVDSNLNILWRKPYRIRNGKDDGYLYDIKSCTTGGYIIAAASYLDDAIQRNGETYYLPWLLRIDDDGCLIPGCNIVNNKDQTSDLSNHLMIYPNPASNYIVLLHSTGERTRYQIISTEGKIMDDFYSTIEGEQIIIPINIYAPGPYFVKVESKKGNSSKLFIKK